MSEAFQVIFNSQGSNVLNATSLNAVVYNVNWGTFLPKKYKKFHCQFVFKSQNYNGALVNNGFVNMNLGRVSVFDGQQMSTNLGIIYPQYLTAAAVSYYTSTNNDNNDFWIDYPINNTITVTLNTFAGAPMANVPHYVIMLNLIGIEDNERLGIAYEDTKKGSPFLAGN
jgi:hypothetical protein